MALSQITFDFDDASQKKGERQKICARKSGAAKIEKEAEKA